MAIPFRRILVPIDFTDVSSSALDWAIELAGSLGASVTVMHTYVIPVVGFPDGALIPSAEMAIGLTQPRVVNCEVGVMMESMPAPLAGTILCEYHHRSDFRECRYRTVGAPFGANAFAGWACLAK